MTPIPYIDHHCHVYGTGYKMLHPKLDNASSIDEILTIIRDRYLMTDDLLPTNFRWIVARGWDQNKWQNKDFPTREHLDSISLDIPIVLIRIDGHALWCNSKALELAAITAETPIPYGGDILKTSAGIPNGILLDSAMDIIYDAIPAVDNNIIEKTIRAGLIEFGKHHIGVHDMGIPGEWWPIYKKLYSEEGYSLINCSVFLDMMKPSGKKLFLDNISNRLFNDTSHSKLYLVGIKLYLDGALGSRGANLFEAYSDDPDNYGLRLMNDAEALDLMNLASDNGLQIALHAIGDAANARALDLITKTRRNNANAIFRIEHAQVVRESDMLRMNQLDVAAIIQPQFFPSDRHWAIDRLGAERMKTAYRWKSLLDAGINVYGSSDSPVEDAEPELAITVLQTRDGLDDGEAVSFYEAQRMYGHSEIDPQ